MQDDLDIAGYRRIWLLQKRSFTRKTVVCSLSDLLAEANRIVAYAATETNPALLDESTRLWITVLWNAPAERVALALASVKVPSRHCLRQRRFSVIGLL